MARPPFVPSPKDRSTVESLVGFGIPQEDICKLIVNPLTGKPINDRTLRRCFKEEIATGTAKAVSQVVGALYKEAIAGNVGAACFFLKNRAGWRDYKHHELAGPGGGPIETKNRQVDDQADIADRIARAIEEENARADAAQDAPGDVPHVGPDSQAGEK